eukprot:m.77239 g.77239  ORF g.77239 m.77239 type:complete len:463 (+) comp14687_c0_seq1:337-1725(+)
MATSSSSSSSSSLSSNTSSLRKTLLVGSLYFVQGLPFGFVTKLLPVYMRQQGFSLSQISGSSLLFLPWLLKPLWAPFVEHTWSPRWGRRRTWILPMTAIMALCCLLMAALGLRAAVPVLLILNVATATQDVAVDGLCIDIMTSDADLVNGNAAQVAGYKLGMLATSGAILFGCEACGAGFGCVQIAMAAVIFLVLVIFVVPLNEQALTTSDADDKASKNSSDTASHHQQQQPAASSSNSTGVNSPHTAPKQSLSQVIGEMAGLLSTPYSLAMVGLLLTYKFGETLSDRMFKPFLVDHRFSASNISLWSGVYGMAFSIAGSSSGSFLTRRFSVLRAAALVCCLELLPQFARFYLSLGSPDPLLVQACVYVEAYIGGLITTLVFALMMAHVSKSSPATHYTLLASVEVFGKGLAGVLSGFLAESYGYAFLFGLGTLSTALSCLWFVPLLRYERALVTEIKAHAH